MLNHEKTAAVYHSRVCITPGNHHGRCLVFYIRIVDDLHGKRLPFEGDFSSDEQLAHYPGKPELDESAYVGRVSAGCF